MPQFDGLLAMIPVGDIAKQLGIDESVAELAVQQVLPALVSGMAANAKDEAGAKSLEKAHATVLPIVAPIVLAWPALHLLGGLTGGRRGGGKEERRRYSLRDAPCRSVARATAASFASVASPAVRVRSLARKRNAKVSDALPSGTPAPR